MNTEAYKKPSLDTFRKVVSEMGGNLSMVARRFGVSRTTIWHWTQADDEFRQVVKDERLKMYDEALSTARQLARGIPAYEDVLDDDGNPVLDENGKRKKKMAGWIDRPDSGMVRYFLGSLGKADGFKDADDEGNVKNGVSIKAWIQKMNDGDAETGV